MSSLVSYLVAYLLGGVTFLPAILIIVLCHAHYTQPVVRDGNSNRSLGCPEEPVVSKDEDDTHTLKNLPPEVTPRTHEREVAAGYFAVCREYKPGPLTSGKPPERGNSAGANGETPSVYQSMYRSLFERGKSLVPSLEGNETSARGNRNVFFIVIRFVSV